MPKTIFALSILVALTAGCGTRSGAHADTLAGTIDAERVALYDRVVEAGLASYEAELEAAAARTYPSRQAALAAARLLGSEYRMIAHLRDALEAEGLTVDDLCSFNASHPGFADALRPHFRERTDHWDDLVEAIATAAAEAPEGHATLTASAPIADAHGG